MDLEKIQEFRDKQVEQADVQKKDNQHQELAGTLNNLLLATMVSKDPKMVEVAKNLSVLLQSIADASDNFKNSSLHLLPMANAELAQSIGQLADKVEQHSSQTDLNAHFQRLSTLLMRVADMKPVVNVPTQPVTVELKPLLDAVKSLQAEVKSNKVDIPKTDLSSVVDGLRAVQKTINGLSFPVPNYVLPFKDASGKAVQVQLDGSGNLPVAATIDTSAIATSANQTNGTQKTQIVDAGGEAATVTGGKLDVNATVDTTGLALDATLTNKTQFAKLTDGTDTALITASGEQNVLATAQPGVDIGDVTINNASGGSAVNVQDGGNSLTVDYATTGSGTATGALRVELPTNGTGVLATLGTITNVVHVDDNSGSLTVDNGGTFAVQSTPVAPTTIYNGKKTVTTAGTRVTLAASQAVKSVVIKALAANTGIIYVGDASVASTNGFALAAGEIVSLDIANLSTVNLDSSVNGEGVTYVGTN